MKIYTAKPYVNDETCNNVVAMLKSGNIAQGEKVNEFEEVFSRYCNTKYGAAVNSGTAALHAAFFAVGIQAGDEVITTPFTFIATANSILMLGAKPVFADIIPETFNLDPDDLERKITSKTKAVIPVHLFGLIADMKKINDIAKSNNLYVIEDACQAHGATYDGKTAGSLGDMGTFSFYATKNITTAEGGMVVSNNKEYIDIIKSFRHHGQSPAQVYDYLRFGYNYRMTDIQATIGLGQMKEISLLNQRRLENATIYNEELHKLRGISIPFVPDGFKHVYHQYTIKVNKEVSGFTRDELAGELKRHDIFPGVFYPKPLHLLKNFEKYGYKKNDLPVSEKICEQVLSLPVHPFVPKYDIYRIVEIIAAKTR